MRIIFSCSLVCLLLGGAGCSAPPPERTYPFHGQVQSLDADHLHAVIKHDEVKGFMMAMTMAYKVKEARELDGIVPGDLIDATLVVVSNDGYLTNVKKVGHAPVAQPAATDQPATSGFELLKAGEPVPNATFTDQDGKTRTFGAFKGSVVVLTFIYTQCPLPNFCPLMDRNFV